MGTDDVQARSSDSWVIAIPNQKGGVGKSTMALALAAVTADANGQALTVDVDPQSSMAEQADRISDPRFDFVQELNPAVLKELRQLRNYDTIYVDCPGSLEGQEVLDQVLDNAHFAVIPFTPDPWALNPTLRTARYVADRGVPYKVLLNNIDPRLGADEVEATWEAFDQAGIARFRCFVRQYRAYPKSLLEGVTITQYRGAKAASAREDVTRVHTELLLDLSQLGTGGGT